MFDENLIEIVKKYGIAGAAGILGVSASDVQAAMGGQSGGLALTDQFQGEGDKNALRGYLEKQGL